MRRKYGKIGLLLFASGVLLAGCGEKVDPEVARRQEIYEQNTAAVADISEENIALIEQSYGRLPTPDEVDPNLPEGTQPAPIGTLNPGEEMVTTLSSYTREELLAVTPQIQINVFLNGVLRDEYRVAAHTLYGKENVAQFKQAFKDALLKDMPVAEDEKPYKVADTMGLNTELEDGDVARHHVDEIVKQLNRVYLMVEVNDNFGDKVTVNASSYGIDFRTQAANMRAQAHNFVSIPEGRYAFEMTDAERAELNSYYKDTFGDALANASMREEPKTVTLAGFEKNADGNWVPSQMERLAEYLLQAAYLQ